MIWLLVICFVLGVSVLLAWRARARRTADQAVEENQRAGQDRDRRLELMHLMTEALGGNLTRPELQQRVVHAAIVCTDALSACLFECTDRSTVRGVADEGLFPPHGQLSSETKARRTTRAKFIAEVLKFEEFPIGDGIIGQVAASGRGELIAEAAADRRLVKHDDPALAWHSLIAVPVAFHGRVLGVLALANPASGQPFTVAEFSLAQSLAEQAALALQTAESRPSQQT